MTKCSIACYAFALPVCKGSSFHQLNATDRYNTQLEDACQMSKNQRPVSPKKVGSQETMIDMASLCKLKGSTMKG